MDTNRLEHYLMEEVPSQPLFSDQFIKNMKQKVTRIEEVVKKFINKKTITEKEKDEISKLYVIDKKWSTMINIVSKYSERKNLKVLESLISAINETQTTSELKSDLEEVYAGRAAFLSVKEKLEEALNYISNLKDQLEDVKRELDSTHEALEKSQQGLKELNKTKDISTLEQEMKDLKQKKEELQKEIKDKQLVIEKTNADLKNREKELNESIQNSNKLNSKIESLEEDLKKATSDSIENDKLKKQLSEEIKKLQGDVTMQEEQIRIERRKQSINITTGQLEDLLKKSTSGLEQKLDFLTNVVMKNLKKE